MVEPTPLKNMRTVKLDHCPKDRAENRKKMRNHHPEKWLAFGYQVEICGPSIFIHIYPHRFPGLRISPRSRRSLGRLKSCQSSMAVSARSKGWRFWMFFGKAAAVLKSSCSSLGFEPWKSLVNHHHFYKNGGNSILLDDEKVPKIMVLSETNLYRKWEDFQASQSVTETKILDVILLMLQKS